MYKAILSIFSFVINDVNEVLKMRVQHREGYMRKIRYCNQK